MTDATKTVLFDLDGTIDVLGAKAAGISCIGIAYGFGGREDLEAFGAWSICNGRNRKLFK